MQSSSIPSPITSTASITSSKATYFHATTWAQQSCLVHGGPEGNAICFCPSSSLEEEKLLWCFGAILSNHDELIPLIKEMLVPS